MADIGTADVVLSLACSQLGITHQHARELGMRTAAANPGKTWSGWQMLTAMIDQWESDGGDAVVAARARGYIAQQEAGGRDG